MSNDNEAASDNRISVGRFVRHMFPARVAVLFVLAHAAIMPLFQAGGWCLLTSTLIFWGIVDFPASWLIMFLEDATDLTATQANLLLLIVGGVQWRCWGWIVGVLISKLSVKSKESSQHVAATPQRPWLLTVTVITAILLFTRAVVSIQTFGREAVESSQQMHYEHVVETFRAGSYHDATHRCDQYLRNWPDGVQVNLVRELRDRAQTELAARAARAKN